MATEAESRRVLYSGRVQGVGFRFRTHQIPQGFAVTGFVRNLRDGRVELVAEGSPGEIDQFLGHVSDALAGSIDQQTFEEGPATGKFITFEIAH